MRRDAALWFAVGVLLAVAAIMGPLVILNAWAPTVGAPTPASSCTKP